MMIKTAWAVIIALSLAQFATAQIKEKKEADEKYIDEVEDRQGSDKVLHAEPLYIDLIRDLGARKGEKEWNVGIGLTDRNRYDEYTTLIEYEFAPVNRLGFEVELPFTFNASNIRPLPEDGDVPGSRLNGLKLATQYSFFVSEKISTSMAIGYIHEFGMTEFRNYGRENLFNGHVFSPFFVAAKRWGSNFHTLLYTGPVVEKEFGHQARTAVQVNSNFHYMIPGTRNFIGLEMNKQVHAHAFDMVLRPQMRVDIADSLLVGIVAGVPIKKQNERFSNFIRLIYEPGHRKK